MLGTSEEVRIDGNTGPAKKAARKRDRRTIAIGDVVTVERKKLCGEVEALTFRLAAVTNRDATPMELGPEVPVHRAVIGHHPGDIVSIPAPAKIIALEKPARRGH